MTRSPEGTAWAACRLRRCSHFEAQRNSKCAWRPLVKNDFYNKPSSHAVVNLADDTGHTSNALSLGVQQDDS